MGAEPIHCPCGLLLAKRTPAAVVAVRQGRTFLDPAAIRCERCGAIWMHPDMPGSRPAIAARMGDR